MRSSHATSRHSGRTLRDGSAAAYYKAYTRTAGSVATIHGGAAAVCYCEIMTSFSVDANARQASKAKYRTS